MTDLLKKYLKFTTKNKQKLAYATSPEAYDCDRYFECFYDGGNDAIYLHTHAQNGEISTYLTHPEDLDQYESELNDCIDLIKKKGSNNHD